MRMIGISVVVFGFTATALGQYTRLPDLPVYYDVRTGNLTVDSTNVEGGTFFAYVFHGPLGSDGYRPEAHTPFMGTLFVDSSPHGVGETNLSGIDAGVYSLGNVLPPDMSESELRNTYFFDRGGLHDGGLQDRYYNYYAIGPLGSASYHIFQPVYSPSPFPPINDPTAGFEVDRWAEQVLISYDATNGGLTLDTTGERGGTIWMYEISLNAPEFRFEAFQPVSTLAPGLWGDDTITESAFAGIPPGVYPLGPILPSGMTVDEVTGLFDELLFIGEPGHWADSLDVQISGVEMAFAYVPEPAPAWLLPFAALAVALARRRNRSAAFHQRIAN